MKEFKNTITSDGSFTMYSNQYKQYYHNIKEGALTESIAKYVIPTMKYVKSYNLKHLNIYDCCFGLGYNTLATIYYVLKYNIDITINFYSPELNGNLVESLKNFPYPKEFDTLQYIIDDISNMLYFKNNQFYITVSIENARDYVKTLQDINIIYQDAFSSNTNCELWTKQYFEDVYSISTTNCMICTYSISSNIRLSMSECGFEIYEFDSQQVNRQTIALKYKQTLHDMKLKYIDMNLKRQRNINAKALSDLYLK